MGLSLAYDAWLRSSSFIGVSGAYLLGSFGVPYYSTALRYAVRPASLDCDKLKKPRISRTFGVIARIYDAWLRSGLEADVDRVYRFDDIGELAVDVAFGRYAVRPALLNCNKLKKSWISRTFWVYCSHITPGCVPALAKSRMAVLVSLLPVVVITPMPYATLPCVPLQLVCEKFIADNSRIPFV